ncbi:MAG: ATP-binding protein [Bryobacteraceae bacterium]
MPLRKITKEEQDVGFRALFEDNPQPMWVFDRETLKFLEVNRAALDHYGYTRQELLSKRLTDVRPPEDVPRLLHALAHLGDSGSVGVWRHQLKDGSTIHVEVAVRAIAYAGRRAVLAVLTDVTGRQLLEQQLRHAQKMEAVGMLAGGIAHDFNNLLTIINGYSQLLLSGLPPNDVNRTAVKQIMKAGDRAAALTRQLLAFSRRQTLQPKVIEVNQLVTGLGVLLRRLIGEDVELHLKLAPDAGRINVDAGQIEQVVMNLAVNARDAMPDGGALTLETRNVVLDKTYAATHLAVTPGPYVLIAVSDTGVGMDAQTRARLFEPFFTTKAQGRGTGLGLSIVFGIVKQSGGNVEVYSEPGKGTSVKVYLPRADQPAIREMPGGHPEAQRGSETILLVEDDEMVRGLVRQTLEREGYKLLDAAAPEQALRIARDYREPIHLMITDVIMPRLNGRELAGKMSGLRPQMRVLFMSGYTDNAVVANGVLDSEMPFIQKPFTPAALAQKVRQVLEAKTRHA